MSHLLTTDVRLVDTLMSGRTYIIHTGFRPLYVSTAHTYIVLVVDTVEDMDSICTDAGYIHKFIPKSATNALI